MKHNGTIQAICGKDNLLADYLIRIFNKEPNAFKIKSKLSDALDDTANLVIGGRLPYSNVVEAITILKENTGKTNEINELGEYLQNNITDFVDFPAQKPASHVQKPTLVEVKRLEKNTSNDNMMQ